MMKEPTSEVFRHKKSTDSVLPDFNNRKISAHPGLYVFRTVSLQVSSGFMDRRSRAASA